MSLTQQVITFKDIITDTDQHKIRLKTIDGAVGYQIKKFKVMPFDIDGTTTVEASLQVWTDKQAAQSADIDFSAVGLLAAAYYLRTTTGGGTPNTATSYESIHFDNTIFNQDIFITYEDGQNAQKMNYYIELMPVKLRENENFYISLKDIKNSLPQHGP